MSSWTPQDWALFGSLFLVPTLTSLWGLIVSTRNGKKLDRTESKVDLANNKVDENTALTKENTVITKEVHDITTGNTANVKAITPAPSTYDHRSIGP